MTYQLFTKILLFFLISFSLHLKAEEKVLVSVAPYLHIVEKIIGEEVSVSLLVPPGASSHTYEPTPKQVQALSSAKIWFCLGEPSDEKAKKALLQQNPHLLVVDLHEGLDLIEDDHGCCHHHDSDQHSYHHHSFDPHIWMSPKLMVEQVQKIEKALNDAFPERGEHISQNAKSLIQDLQALDRDIKHLFKNKSPVTVIVAHPAYAYFCRDYGLTELSIEQDGKDPTAKELTHLLEKARSLQVKKIFIQNQYSHKGAELIAKELKAQIVILNPYSENYFPMMEKVAYEFSTSMQSCE